jgi:hypothetical protein
MVPYLLIHILARLGVKRLQVVLHHPRPPALGPLIIIIILLLPLLPPFPRLPPRALAVHHRRHPSKEVRLLPQVIPIILHGEGPRMIDQKHVAQLLQRLAPTARGAPARLRVLAHLQELCPITTTLTP